MCTPWAALRPSELLLAGRVGLASGLIRGGSTSGALTLAALAEEFPCSHASMLASIPSAAPPGTSACLHRTQHQNPLCFSSPFRPSAACAFNPPNCAALLQELSSAGAVEDSRAPGQRSSHRAVTAPNPTPTPGSSPTPTSRALLPPLRLSAPERNTLRLHGPSCAPEKHPAPPRPVAPALDQLGVLPSRQPPYRTRLRVRPYSYYEDRI